MQYVKTRILGHCWKGKVVILFIFIIIFLKKVAILCLTLIYIYKSTFTDVHPKEFPIIGLYTT